MADPDDVVARARNLEGRIETQRTVVDDLLDYSAKSRRLSRISIALSIVVALIGCLSVATALRAVNNSADLAHVEDITSAAAAALLKECEDDNVDKAKEAELWRLIFAIPPRADSTPEQKEQAAQIEAFVATVYGPEVCKLEVP